MRAALLAAILALAPVAGAASTVYGTAGTGLVVLQEWDVFNLWVNATGTLTLDLEWWGNWSGVNGKIWEDLSLTVYHPGAWDRQCGSSAHRCTYDQRSGDARAQSGTGRTLGLLRHDCGMLGGGKERLVVPGMTTGRYHVVVEADLAAEAPFKLQTSAAGSLTFNGTTTTAVVYVPPC